MHYAALALLVRHFTADRNAASSIEYAMIASCIAVAIVGAVVALGSEVRDGLFQKIVDAYPS
ncbi:MAG TPA: Flp family type IVb pilin [Xanthobacteraceae bacterium]|nr:Flp family type IVb pilin [Xanthobacteraceae bacterium]